LRPRSAGRFLAALLLALGAGAPGLPAADSARRLVADPFAAARAAASREAAAAPAGSPPGVDGAVAWLAAGQNTDGSWGADLEWIVTSTAVESLAGLDPCLDPLPRGATWLATRGAAPNHDFLARKVGALSMAPGYEHLAPTLELLAARHPAEPNGSLPNWPEGGWGLADGYETDSLTTALALLALDRAGLNGGFAVTNQALAGGATNLHVWEIPDDATKARIVITVSGSQIRLRMREGTPPTVFDPYFPLLGGPFLIVFPDSGLPFTPGTNYISIQSPSPPGTPATYTMTGSYETPSFDTRTLAEPLDYLREAQNPDGGWGLQRGQPSELYTTLHVLLALLRYAPYDLDAEIAAGVAHVKARQQPGGSFGYGGSPIAYVTALAALGLMRADAGVFSPETEQAIAALAAMQAGDGSWAGEPYDTAVAALALWEHGLPPTADAGDDQTVSDADGDCAQPVTLSGSGTAAGGATVAGYSWREGCVAIASGSSPTVALPVGRHRLELVVTDSDGQTGRDRVEIAVFGPADVDGDAVPESCGDCDDANPLVWAAPGEVLLALSHSLAAGETTIRWGPADRGGLLLPRHDVLCSPDPADFVAAAVCLETDDLDLLARDLATPPPGGVRSCLVRVENDCPGPHSLGADSNGIPRAGVACP
jgi:hypothetical protein